jgi:hypothetical protein
MTWLAPWALVAGVLGGLGVLTAHLLTRQRPRAMPLATARFVPEGVLEATTLQRVPQDRWWLLLRLLALVLLAIGAAQPVFTGVRVPERRVLLLDRTLSLPEQERALASLTASDIVIAMDTLATLTAAPRARAGAASTASISAGLALLARTRDSLALRSRALRVTLASPLAARSFDAGSAPLRALIPDSITVLTAAVRGGPARARGAVTVSAPGDDAIAATLRLLGDSVAPVGSRLQRGEVLLPADSAAARAGGTVVWWRVATSAGDAPLRSVTVGQHTWVAVMAPDSAWRSAAGARIVGWWTDGAPAVTMVPLGAGCVVHVGIALPAAGDQTLSLRAQAWMRELLTVCDTDARLLTAAPAWLAPAPRPTSATATTGSQHSMLAPWLIAGALLLVAVEWLLRTVRRV